MSESPVAPGPSSGQGREKRFFEQRETWFCLLLVGAFAFNSYLLNHCSQFPPQEDHFAMGQSLHQTGSFYEDASVPTFRPPGYPLFVSGVLAIRDALFSPASHSDATDQQAVALAQALLSGLTSAILFLWLSSRFAIGVSVLLTVIYSLNPFLVYLIGWCNYPVLHLFWVVTSCHLTDAALRQAGSAGPHTRRLLLCSGLSWGIATLVRPISLVMPGTVLFLLCAKLGARRAAAILTLVFSVGMALVIVPYTFYNHHSTGRFSVLNPQAGLAIWGTSVEPFGSENEFIGWQKVWVRHGMSIYTEITGEKEYDLQVFLKHSVELNRRFMAEAETNIWNRPSVYLGNVAKNLHSFASASPHEPIARFRHRQNPTPSALTLGGEVISADAAARAAGAALGVAALLGLSLDSIRRRWIGTVALMTYLTLGAVHSATFLTDRYLYVRYPMLVFLIGALSSAGCQGGSDPAQSRGRNTVAYLVCGVLLVLTGVACALELGAF